MKLKKWLAMILCAVLVFTAFPWISLADTYTRTLNGRYAQSDCRAMRSLINDFRTGESWYWNKDNTTKTTVPAGSLGTLTYDYALERIAMQRAAEIAIYFSHTRPNGSSCFSCTYNGVQTWGENIAAGYGSTESVFIGWREDDEDYAGQGHRRNMLHADWTAVGIGCFVYNGVKYWAQEFGRSNSGMAATSANNGSTSVEVEVQSEYDDSPELAVTITKQPKSVSATPGQTVTFSIKATGADAYQWLFHVPGDDETLLWYAYDADGGTTDTYTVTVTEDLDGYTFLCMVRDEATGTWIYSDPAELKVGSKPVITTQPKSVTAYVESTAVFKVVATGATGYQWQWSKDGGSTWKDSTSKTPGYNTAALTVTAAGRNGYKYRCKVTNSFGTVTSSAATLTVSDKPVITAQPKSVTAASGAIAKFTVAASNATSYQWQWSKGPGLTFSDCTSATTGYNTATLQVSASGRNGYRYRCKVTNAYGTTISSEATLTVTAAAKPTITTQPKSVTAYVDKTAKFTVVASGTGLEYRWQWSKDGGSTWKDCTSATTGYNTATLTVNATADRSGYKYRCKVTNSGGAVTSSVATLTVSKKPVITTQPKSVTASSGSTAKFTVAATGATGYQWQWSKDGGSTWRDCTSATTGYNKATLQVSTTGRSGYKYRCKVSNSAGTTTSSVATLTVK